MTLVGIAINKDGVVYFADGANIRTIDVNRKIETIIGSQGQPKYWQPLPCNKIISASEVTRFSKLFFFPERSLANCSWSWVSIPPQVNDAYFDHDAFVHNALHICPGCPCSWSKCSMHLSAKYGNILRASSQVSK